MERIISAYRKDDWADAKGFVVQLGSVLEGYSPEVVDYVTHPATGIQRTCKFPPSLAEVVSACESRISRLAFEKRIQEDETERELRHLQNLEEQKRFLRKEIARCHLWMRSDPPDPKRVAEFSDEIQQQALRMQMSEALELYPTARAGLTKPIDQYKPLIGGIVG